MGWIEIEISCPNGTIDDTIALLETKGFSGFVIEDETDFLRFLEEHRAHWDYIDESLQAKLKGKSLLRFYLEDTTASQHQINILQTELAYPLACRTLQEEDWANNWKRYYKPIAVGKKFLVVPQWMQVETAGKIPLYLDPGLSFGTGSHPSTKSCLCLMEDRVQTGDTVLDLGTGSGILAIAALKLGAKHITACDIDPHADIAVRANMQFNDLSEQELLFHSGNVLTDIALQEMLSVKKYDIVFANIVADVIVPLAAFVPSYLTENGIFICSGIIAGRETEVKQALENAGLSIQETRKEEDWFSFLCQK